MKPVCLHSFRAIQRKSERLNQDCILLCFACFVAMYKKERQTKPCKKKKKPSVQPTVYFSSVKNLKVFVM